jgi:Domain of unknown function (DUF5668)
MNTYLWIHRVKGPVMLLVFGVTALLNQYDIISFGKSWPLYLITFGILQLAERAAWAQAQSSFPTQPPYPGYQSQGYPAQGYPKAAPVPPAGSSTALTITPHDEEGR